MTDLLSIMPYRLKILFQFVFLISPLFLFGKNSDQSISKGITAKTEIEILFEKMEELGSRNMDSCFLFYEKALEISGENEKLEGKTYLKMAQLFHNKNMQKEAIEYFNKVLKINDNDLLYEAYVGLGGVHWSLSNLSEALICDLKTLDIGKKLNSEIYIGRSLLNLGVIYAEIKEYQKSYTYYNQAKEIYQKIDDSYGKAIIVNNLCRLLLDQEKYEEALQSIEKDFADVNTGGDKNLNCVIKSNYAVALIGSGNMEGFSMLKESYIEAGKLGNKVVLSSISLALSKWYLEFELYDEALSITKEGIKEGEKHEIIKYLPELYLNLSNIYRAQNKLEESLSSLEKSNQYKDELLKKRKEKEILGIDIMNLLKQEEMENELLQLKNVNQRRFNFFLILSFLLFAPFLYLVFRRKQRKQIQKFKQRVAADLHDDVGGNLSTISRIAKGIYGQSNSNDVKERVEELVQKSDQSIRNIVDTIWALDEKESQLGQLSDKIEDLIYYADFKKNDSKVEFIKSIENENLSLSMELRHHLLMIFKEGIHNIQKHTVSGFVKISIKESKKSMEILIFNHFHTLKSPNFSTGRGLENMKKRVQEIGGQITFEKSPDQFSIRIKLKI